MLTINVTLQEGYDEKENLFFPLVVFTLDLEHSLVSLSKWESVYKKPFLGAGEKTPEETLAYIQTMTLTPNVPAEVWSKLSQKNMDDIQAYISDTMTATWFTASNERPSNEIITAEVIYHMMIALNIWLEYENRHLNQLLTLIRVCNEKNAPKKKMTPAEAGRRQRELNAQRQAQYGTTG